MNIPPHLTIKCRIEAAQMAVKSTELLADIVKAGGQVPQHEVSLEGLALRWERYFLTGNFNGSGTPDH